MLRVLIAEDERLLAFALRGQLEARECEVVGIASTGTEAVELCCSSRPDVVIMDIRMPEAGGIEATRRIMQQCPTCVVMLTAFGQSDQVSAAEEAGAMAYLVKPVNADQLIPAVTLARRNFGEFVALRKELTDLQDTLETRKLVERAKGILVDRAGITEAQAFRRLQKLAMDRRVSIKSVAEKIVGTAQDCDALFGS
jgi:response regulator NasT